MVNSRNSAGGTGTGTGQKPQLQYPLDPQGYQATVIFQPVERTTIVQDLESILSGTRPVNIGLGVLEDDPDADVAQRKKSARAAEDRLDARGVPDPRTVQANEFMNPNVLQSQRNAQIREDEKAFEGQTGAYATRTGSPRDPALLYRPLATGPVKLYLPQAIQITDGVQVGPIDLGVAGAGVEAALSAGRTRPGEIAQQALAGADITSIVDIFKNRNLTGTAGAFTAQRVARAAGFEGVAGAISRGTSVQVNPNTRSLFRAVNLREFSFTFKMIATSQAEAESIKAIIKFFREELYPEEIPLSVGPVTGALAYRMPNLFDIKFLYKNNQEIATKLKPTYLRNFSATYNPSGMGIHDDGNFLETDITMSFVEDTTLSRQNVNEGY